MITRKVFLLLIVLSMGITTVYADTELEHLAVISTELEHVLKLIESTENRHKKANADAARIKFRYGALMQRVKSIQIDIARHIAWVQENPKYDRFVLD